MTWIDSVGYLASSLVLITFCMKTILPLRTIAVGSNVGFIAYGALAEIYPVMVLHSILLPLNLWRIYEALRLVRTVETAARTDFSSEWLRPYMASTLHDADSLVFRKGDPADRLFLIVSGEVELPELGIVLDAGEMFGEIGLFSPAKTRTQTARCRTTVELASITEASLVDLCYSNPAITFHLLRLTTNRLLQDIAQLETTLATTETSPV